MTAPEGQPPPPTHIAGYRVERVLAVTAMATVYLVHSPTLPRREVLKVLQPEHANGDHVRAQFLHEADITAGLEHPNIVRVFSRGETDTGQLWIAMEYVEGTNAETALRDGQMTPERAVHIITEVARALDYAHSHGVVHQDIKPSNFLIAAQKLPGGLDRVVLTDFGAALSPHSRGAGDGPMSATLAYSAPEVITGTAALDGRADVYSLACTLFRLLTGEHPYPTDAGVGATVKAHLDTTPPRVSDRLSWASPQLDSVIAKALAKNPADRYPTAGDFAAAANAAPTLPLPLAPVAPRDDRDEPPPRTELGGAESHGAAADFISLLPHTRAVSQRRQLLAAIAVAGVLIVALSVWLIGRGSDPPDTAPTAAPQTTSTAPPSEILREPGKNYSAVVSGTLNAPEITAPPQAIAYWSGPISMIAAQAGARDIPAYPEVTARPVATSTAAVRTDRIRTAQAGQLLLFLLMMLLAGMVLSNLVEEKANKVIEVLAAAIPMDAVFLGKLVAMLGVSFVGIAVWVMFGGAIALLAGEALPRLPDTPYF